MIFERTIQNIGQHAFDRLSQKRIIIFGIGGVGGWCAEALVRTGIQHLTLVDFDTINDTNINRQIVATSQNIGKLKVEEMAIRLKAINPHIDLTLCPVCYQEDNYQQWDFNQYDYVVDAIDMIDAKIRLIHEVTSSHATLFSSMGAGRKQDTEAIRVSDFRKVEGCPLARALRQRMKRQELFPAHSFLCVWSPELSSDCGTIAPIVGVFGMKLANLVIQDILQH